MATHRTYFVIADISGYTAYLTGNELEHAQDILSDLLETLLNATRPLLELVKLEGDAAFLYAPRPRFDGPSLFALVEACYAAFRRRLTSIRQLTSCSCTACSSISSLNLKLCLHHGQYVRQRIAGHEELAGPDIILVHRLLKNSIPMRGYAVLTQACLQAMKMDPALSDMVPHREAYEHLGELSLHVVNLEARFEKECARSPVRVTSEDGQLLASFSLPGTVAQIWPWLTEPELRGRWGMGTTFVSGNGQAPRSAGNTNHCVHGRRSMREEILDLRPLEYITDRKQVLGIDIVTTVQAVAAEQGCRVEIWCRPPGSLWGRAFYTMMFRSFARKAWQSGLKVLGDAVAAEEALAPPGPIETDERKGA